MTFGPSDEGVEVGQAHRAVHRVEGVGERDPVVDDLAEGVVAVVDLGDGHEARVVGLRGPGHEDPERGGGLLGRPDVHVVRERLGPVLPRVHGRVGAHVLVGPVRRRALRVVAVHGRAVVLALVAEEGAERVARPGLVDEDRLVVVPELVAQVADHRAVGLAELQAALGAYRVVGLRHVDRDDAVGVAGDHRLPGAREQVEDQLALADGQPDVEEHAEHPALGALGAGELRETCEIGVVRPRPRQPAGQAQLTRLAGLEHPVALREPGVRAAAQVALVLGARLQRREIQPRGDEALRGPAAQAQAVLEEQQQAAVVTDERTHSVVIPRRRPPSP